jgi:hypothetical protein
MIPVWGLVDASEPEVDDINLSDHATQQKTVLIFVKGYE